MTTDIHTKFVGMRDDLNASLIDREDEIDAALVAMLTGEHCLFVGPPGTGKSLLSDTLVKWLNGTSFSAQLTKFTQPDELFGPVSVTGLKADEFRRITDGMLPEADVAYLDEIWKGSSAILNTLLQLLNERTFKNGKSFFSCPLKLCIAASNEWPQGVELGALFDRFLLRRTVDPIGTPDGLQRLVFDSSLTPTLRSSLTTSELESAQMSVRLMPFHDSAKDALIQIRHQLATEGITVGDRRLRKSADVCRASAWLAGDSEVTTEHFVRLSDVLWSTPDTANTSRQVIVDIAKPSSMLFAQSLAQAHAIVAKINKDDIGSLSEGCSKLSAILADAKTQPGGAALVSKVESLIMTLREHVLRVSTNI